MATTVYTLESGWSATNRYTAGSETDVQVSNPNDTTAIHWTITTSDTVPSTDPANANKILVGDKQSLTLATGDRLWVCGSKGYATLEV